MRAYLTVKTMLLLLIVLGSPSTQSYAQNTGSRWVYITRSTDGTKAYLEKTYKELDNGNRTIWVKYVKTDGRSSLNLWEVDCKLEKYKILEIVNYDRLGNVV